VKAAVERIAEDGWTVYTALKEYENISFRKFASTLKGRLLILLSAKKVLILKEKKRMPFTGILVATYSI
jgi:hypothetical protein